MRLFGWQCPQHGAEDIGPGGQIARADAVADFLRLQSRHDSEGGAKFGGNGGAGRGDEFVRFVDLAQGDAGQDFQGCWRGEGVRAMRALDGPTPVLQTRDENLLDPSASMPTQAQTMSAMESREPTS
jgi:hypothetical protein